MKTISKTGFLVFSFFLLSGCGFRDKELDGKYGLKFNEIRKENHIPLLPSEWLCSAYFPFRQRSIGWFPKTLQKKGHVNKSVYVDKKRKIASETDEYISDITIKSHDPDCGTDVEHLFIRYFFDDTEKHVIKTEVFLTAEKECGKTSLKNAKKYFDKWEINVPELDYLIEKFESSPPPEGNKGSK